MGFREGLVDEFPRDAADHLASPCEKVGGIAYAADGHRAAEHPVLLHEKRGGAGSARLDGRGDTGSSAAENDNVVFDLSQDPALLVHVVGCTALRCLGATSFAIKKTGLATLASLVTGMMNGVFH